MTLSKRLYEYVIVLVLLCWSSPSSRSSSGGIRGVEAGASSSPQKNLNLLMVGNSFSEAHSLEDMVQAMLEERKILLQADSLFAARFDQGGAHLENYVNNTALTNLMGERQWTWVVLQEQSELPGFIDFEGLDIYQTSLDSVVALNDKIQANGATTVLFQTWGYFEKDPYNADYYTDYLTMQGLLNKGYQKYQDEILAKNPSASVKIAPAGSAFQWIFENTPNPLQTDSAFDQLYDTLEAQKEQDTDARKYPSLQGAYLTACVLFQTLTGMDVRQISYVPPPNGGNSIDLSTKNRLQQAANSAVLQYSSSNSNGNNGNNGNKYSGGDSRTKPPYIPSSSSSSFGGSMWSSGTSKFILVVVFALGFGTVAAKRRQQPPFHGGSGSYRQPQQYAWNALAGQEEDVSTSNTGAMSVSMELTDFTSSSQQRQL